MRSLFVALTGLCCWLGYWAESARRQRDAVEVLSPVAAIGYDDDSFVSGESHRDEPRPGLVGWLEKRIGSDYFRRVDAIISFRDKMLGFEHLRAITELDSIQDLILLFNESVDDSFVAQLVGLRRLHRLDLNHTSITDAGLRHIALFSRLELLSVGDNDIDGSGFRSLQASPSLRYFSLTNTEVTDKYLDDLGGCHRLRYVDLRNTHVTAGGVARLQQTLPNCEIRWPD